ncbi:MAG: hypothetical protein BWY06_02397 [Candidatus Latescibacteria bacterium ADurb.Bin168]|nr:MAG: hypothetical protein BWY06_02397 [Candidatus Latescibacteria bacterium ADurb.Bin168]
MEPGLITPLIGVMVVMGLHSVSPYPSRMPTPNRASKRR